MAVRSSRMVEPADRQPDAGAEERRTRVQRTQSGLDHRPWPETQVKRVHSENDAGFFGKICHGARELSKPMHHNSPGSVRGGMPIVFCAGIKFVVFCVFQLKIG